MSEMSSVEIPPARVLIIDDDEAHAEALADGLEIDGHACRLAHSGREGLERMGEETFDAVLTDLVMHDLSGLEVTAHAFCPLHIAPFSRRRSCC